MRRPVVNGAPKPRWSTEIRSLGLFSTSGAAFEKSGLSCAKQMLGVKLEFELTPVRRGFCIFECELEGL